MASLNKVQLIGYLGKDPDVRETNGGQVVANFSVAMDESYKNKDGEKVEKTEWANIVIWGPLADIAEKYLHKGDRVYLEGKLQTRKYEDTKSSTTKYVTEVVVFNMVMLQTQRSDDAPARQAMPAQRQARPAQRQEPARRSRPAPAEREIADEDFSF